LLHIVRTISIIIRTSSKKDDTSIMTRINLRNFILSCTALYSSLLIDMIFLSQHHIFRFALGHQEKQILLLNFYQDSPEQKVMLRLEVLSFHLSSTNSKYSTFFYSLMQLIPPSLATQRKASGESVSDLSQRGVVDKSFSDRAISHC
jgi:hypothetical protein